MVHTPISLHRSVRETGWPVVFTCAILTLSTLAACAPSPAAPAEAITEVPTAIVPTDTATSLPTPTATATQAPTATLEPTTTNTPAPTANLLEGRQGLIAFLMIDQAGWGGIHVIPADGSSAPLELSWHHSIDRHPSWSPDGSQIAFQSHRDDPVNQEFLDIYTMNADGSGLTRLTNTDAVYEHPDWSPDGSQIALASDKEEPGNLDLYLLNLKTKELNKLTDGPALDGEPSWSPDGSMIAFASDRDGTLDVYTIEVSTGETVQLTHDSGFTSQPDWSPDGEKILFKSDREGDAEIYVMDADGANPVRLTNMRGEDLHPEWAPDGKTFAFAHQLADGLSIYVSDLDGSSPKVLVGKTGGYPAWSVAEVTLPEGPVIGPPFCARDTDGDGDPNTDSATFTTEDDMGFILFPYDNAQDGMDFWYTLSIPGINGEHHPSWDGGESGSHITWFALQHATGVVSAKFYLGEKLMQEIECEVVEP